MLSSQETRTLFWTLFRFTFTIREINFSSRKLFNEEVRDNVAAPAAAAAVALGGEEVLAAVVETVVEMSF